MTVPGLSIEYFQLFFLMLVRVTTVLMTLPVFSSRSIPAMVKIGLGMMVVFILVPLQPPLSVTLPRQLLPFAILIGQEVLIGLLMSFAAILVFSALQMAGQVIGTQMGLNMASSLDPLSSGQQISYLDQLYSLFAALVFLTINGHHLVLRSIQQSFDLLPVGQFAFSEALSNGAVQLTADSLVMALRLALPIIGTLLLTDVAFLIVGRTAPQMNIFMTGIPMKLGVAFLALLVTFPVTINVMGEAIQGIVVDVDLLLRLMARGTG